MASILCRGGAFAVLLAAFAAAGGCSSSAPADRDDATQAGPRANDELYGLPAMQRAEANRTAGNQEIELAYAAHDPAVRERHFQRAYDLYDKTQVAYHEALAQALPRYRPDIEREIEAVHQRMRDIQNDRPQRSVTPGSTSAD